MAITLLAPVGAFAQQSVWQTYFDNAKQALDADRMDAAEEQIALAVKEAKRFEKTDERYLRTLGLQASIFEKLDELGKARSTLKKLVKYSEKAYGDESVGAAHVLRRLGEFDLRAKRYTAARKVLERAARIFDRSGNLLETARSCNSVALCFDKQGNLKKAEEWYRLSLKAHERCYARSDHSVTLGNLGLLYLDTKRVTEAVALLEQADELARGEGPQYRFMSARNLANALEAAGKLKRAIAAQIDAHAAAEEYYGEKHEATEAAEERLSKLREALAVEEKQARDAKQPHPHADPPAGNADKEGSK